ncbi:hypothetical protein NQ318_022967 [Aromia moschata]|uniref:Transposable element P transposase-like RNase H C-terminal domain-containing protein n=1 Tax=Aromia moschata TaxID=1265417 RepID=A0AAV8YEN9_9CUCU|nr:hypothetical protein NQ318_022967 [Aromia moschata]
MSEVITQLKVINSRSKLPFQKGILLSNSALQMLMEDLNRRFGAQYLLTRRINQDVIENFFGVIRAKGGLHDHPSPLEFKYRLRSFILGKNQGAYSDYSNVELDDTPDIPLKLNELEYDGLENLAGFVCHKLRDPTLQNSSSQGYSWIDHLSEGDVVEIRQITKQCSTKSVKEKWKVVLVYGYALQYLRGTDKVGLHEQVKLSQVYV